MSEFRLSEIWIYPVKSLGGVRLNHATVQEKGLKGDRRWMLVDEDGMFMTQRLIPGLALFKVEEKKEHLKINFEGNSITLPTENSSPVVFKARVWDDTVDVVEVSNDVSSWFSEHLKMKCKLVAFPEENPRQVDPRYSLKDGHVSLADAFPFLIIGQESLNLLNSKMEQPLPMNRFRPNFVFSGGMPHDEDTWQHFTIGNNRFVGVKPCSRCVLTTVNQDTAEKGAEPLRTLSTYRKRDAKIYFGQNLLAEDFGTVKVGDVISVQTHIYT